MTPFKKKTDDKKVGGSWQEGGTSEGLPRESAKREAGRHGVYWGWGEHIWSDEHNGSNEQLRGCRHGDKENCFGSFCKKMSAQDKKQKGEALLAAAKKGNTSEIESLLNQGASPNCVTNEGWIALHSAAQGGKRDMLDILLSYGADPTLQIKLGDWGFTPLHLAAREGHKEIVRPLVKADKKGIALRTKNLQGKLPSDLARESIANYLIKKMGDK